MDVIFHSLQLIAIGLIVVLPVGPLSLKIVNIYRNQRYIIGWISSLVASLFDGFMILLIIWGYNWLRLYIKEVKILSLLVLISFVVLGFIRKKGTMHFTEFHSISASIKDLFRFLIVYPSGLIIYLNIIPDVLVSHITFSAIGIASCIVFGEMLWWTIWGVIIKKLPKSLINKISPYFGVVFMILLLVLILKEVLSLL
jgi:hypothetical protein